MRNFKIGLVIFPTALFAISFILTLIQNLKLILFHVSDSWWITLAIYGLLSLLFIYTCGFLAKFLGKKLGNFLGKPEAIYFPSGADNAYAVIIWGETSILGIQHYKCSRVSLIKILSGEFEFIPKNSEWINLTGRNALQSLVSALTLWLYCPEVLLPLPTMEDKKEKTPQ